MIPPIEADNDCNIKDGNCINPYHLHNDKTEPPHKEAASAPIISSVEADKELSEILQDFLGVVHAILEKGLAGDFTDVELPDNQTLKTSLLAWRDKAVVAEQLDILIWATGGIQEFTEDGKIYIPKKIDELTAQLKNGAKDE